MKTRAAPMRLEVTWQPIDSRLALPPCPASPTVTPTSNRIIGRNSVRVTCDAPAWSLMIGTVARGYQSVVVTTVAVDRGQFLDSSHMTLEERELTSSNTTFYTAPTSLVGFRVKRALAQGTLLSPQVLEAPKVISKGQTVIIEAGNDAFSVTSEGTAMTDGGLGDSIRVKNSNSGRVVEGTVTGEGRIRVPL
jgi:flagella basal body P-ring formation protein FlgA